MKIAEHFLSVENHKQLILDIIEEGLGCQSLQSPTVEMPLSCEKLHNIGKQIAIKIFNIMVKNFISENTHFGYQANVFQNTEIKLCK